MERTSVAAEFYYFLKKHKMWWLLPPLIWVIVLGAVIWVGTSNIAVFIYALF